jgi:cystathionine beta-lyase/cystathionine gamma-synthase
MDISDILNQHGEERSKYFNAVSPPVIQTSNFCFESVETMRANTQNEFEVPFYTRGNNPTVEILRKKIAALEHAEDALITSSGCAAISTSVMANINAGEHIICVKNCYSWTFTLINDILKRFKVESTFIDGTDINNFKNAIRPNTKLIYLESPTSFKFELQDIKAVTALAKQHNIKTIIDNSYSTPLYQNPLDLGVDIVIHSASKYLNGHSDIVAGVICSNKEMIKRIFATELMTFGGIISPETAWLMIRGLRTLPVRIEKSSSSAEMIVDYLEKHPKVETVFYPHSKTHPQYGLAKMQMKRCGGMFSFILKTDDIKKVDAFCNSLKRFLIACSWGGYESLIYPVAVLYSDENNNKPELPFNFIRMYVGLEEPELLIEDLERAFERI